MRLLLDTHVILWWLSDDPSLSEEVKTLIDTEPDVFMSSASLWEVTIKQAMGKLGPADLPERLRDSDLRPLPIGLTHAIVAGRLPAIHRDPFDRMLIAQAQCEDLTLVTRDEKISKYPITVMSV